jgi:hypothetical protein
LENSKISIFGDISKFFFWADFGKFWQFWAVLGSFWQNMLPSISTTTKSFKIPKIEFIHSRLPKNAKSHFGRLGPLGVNWHCVRFLQLRPVNTQTCGICSKFFFIYENHHTLRPAVWAAGVLFLFLCKGLSIRFVSKIKIKNHHTLYIIEYNKSINNGTL